METGHAPLTSYIRTVARRHHLLLLTAVAAALGFRELPTHATGDYYEEPLQTLADYLRLDQLPAKSFEEVLSETTERDHRVPEINYAAELLALTKKPGAEALASVDKMIPAARAAAEGPLLNLLNDIRDVLAGPATAAETESYLEWRIGQADRFGVSFEKPKPGEREEERTKPNAALLADIERQLAKASPALKPHWLYLRGAFEYRAGNIGESQEWFLKVAKDFPKSPRAEVAQYMAARCQIWRTRSPEYTQQDLKIVESERPRAKKLFEEYFAKFPKGRHYGDALGWFAALAFDGRDFTTALLYYLQQLDLADHPELHDMAAQMVERTLSRLASEPRDKAFAEVAKHPPAAQALVYLINNTSESDNFNGESDSIDSVRGWRKAVLPKLAAAISAQAKLYQDAQWKPRHLAMLAFALSGAGQQEQALKLLQTAGAVPDESDDQLFARGIVFHRAKKPAEAITALETLLKKYPESPLAKGARLRLGLAFTDNRQAGEAVLALREMVVKPKRAAAAPAPAKNPQPTDSATEKAEPAEEEEQFYPDYDDRHTILYPIDLHQVRALIDALLNFAPIEELAATSRTPNLDPVLRLQFTEPIAQRLLAREQFDEAKKFMTPAQWGLFAGPIEALTQAARAAKDPAARAAACLKLGDAWAAARGKLLTFPLDTHETRGKVFINFPAEANTRRADSAPFVGAAGNYKLDLENRDELRHAFNCWLEASDAQPGTPLTAQALWRALRAMPQIADVSGYAYERAVARNWGDTSRKLYDRLRTECADSVEAKRLAVAYDFPAPKKPKPEEESYSSHRDADGERFPAEQVFEAEGGYPDGGKETAQMADAARELVHDARTGNPAVVKARVEQLARKAGGRFTSLYDARWVNFFDDMALFFAEPDIAPEVRERYVALRLKFLEKSAIGGGGWDDERGRDAELQTEIQTALADPKTKAAADYFEFLDLAVIANHFTMVTINKDKKGESESKDEDTYRTRDYPLLAKKTQAFLEKYPKSRKREAALLLHARAVFKSSEEVHLRKWLTWPQAPRWEGSFVSTVTSQEPFDAKRVRAALDASDKAFPGGRYAGDIRSYRAALALRLRDWKTALDLTAAQLDDTGREDLRPAAARRLDDIFRQLADERYRADLLAAIKAHPRGSELLTKYLAFEAGAHPLRYMGAWLRTQLAAK
jgi:outer membrane protein assembly factor BamD (BamD/ComL family)